MKIAAKTIKRSKFIGQETINFILRPLHTSLISLLIIRFFDIDLWGEFVVFLVSVEFITNWLNWGQKPFLLREFSLRPKEIGKEWGRIVISRFPFLILLAVLLWLIPLFQTYFFPLIIWVSFKWFSHLFEALIQFHRKYWWSISAEMVAIITSIVCLFVFSDEMNLNGLLSTFAISNTARLLVLLPLLKDWKMPEISIELFKKSLLVSFPFFALTMAGLLQTKGDLYVVTYLLQGQELATYQVIIGFLLIGQTFSSIVLGPFQKNIYRWQGNHFGNLKRLYLKIGLLATLGLSVALYFGLHYIYLIDLTLTYLPLFFVYLFLLYTYLIESQIMLKHNDEKQLLYYNLIAAVSNIVTAFILVNWYGIVGALLSGILCRLILATLIVKRSRTLRYGKGS